MCRPHHCFRFRGLTDLEAGSRASIIVARARLFSENFGSNCPTFRITTMPLELEDSSRDAPTQRVNKRRFGRVGVGVDPDGQRLYRWLHASRLSEICLAGNKLVNGSRMVAIAPAFSRFVPCIWSRLLVLPNKEYRQVVEWIIMRNIAGVS